MLQGNKPRPPQLYCPEVKAGSKPCAMGFSESLLPVAVFKQQAVGPEEGRGARGWPLWDPGSCWKWQSLWVAASQVLPALLVIPVGYETSFLLYLFF